jgi:CheY-like chemotaxis protein
MTTLDPRPTAVVEDNDEDFHALRRALGDVAPDARLVRYRDATEALGALTRLDASGDQWPSLLLLDLNLPGRTGFDVLEILRDDPALRSLPVVVLSGSSRQEDIDACYRQGANAYIVKPMVFDQLRQALVALRAFCAVAAQPSRPGRDGGPRQQGDPGGA